jgi:hypothetical protein
MNARVDPGPGPKPGTKRQQRQRLLPPGPPGDLYVLVARKLKLEGRTDAEVAEFSGIGERTLHNWKAYPAFREAFQEVKQTIVAKALDKLNVVALGGIKTKTVVTIESEKPTKTITTEGETLPDVRALSWVLAIADPERYSLNKLYGRAAAADGLNAHDAQVLIGMLPVRASKALPSPDDDLQ